MKISTRGRYALRLMIDIAQGQSKEQDKPLHLKDVAGRQGISKRYLEQIVISLKNSRLIRGIPGKKGGYVLAKSPDDISVGEIIEAAIGPINVVDCVLDPDACMHSEMCECRPLYSEINTLIRDALHQQTLAGMVSMYGERLIARSLVAADDLDLPDLCSSRFK